MKDEIKEIIELINTKYEDYYIDDFLSGEDVKKLVDYITNLQEENERLRAKKWQIKNLKAEWLDIKENSTLVFENSSLIEFMNNLENILTGGDE